MRENVAQVREILLQLDAIKTADFRAKLQKELGSSVADVGELLAAFFETDDQNFDERYQFFYRELAPSLELYRIRIGDTLTIKAFTRSGYVQSVNLHVYGTFQFQGLEKSTLAGALNLMDLVSFRELYGFLTADKLKEIQQLQKEAGAHEVSRENAEAELFGSKEAPAADDAKAQKVEDKGQLKSDAHHAKTVVAQATAGVSPNLPPGGPPRDSEIPDLGDGLGQRLRRQDLVDRVYAPGETERGVVLNAAVILKDPKLIPQTITAIEAAGERDGLPLKAISWQKASGIIGQFIMMARIVLYVAILIIFVVALVIINNALVMATLERVQEIGTLRAIGAQRRFILAMLVIEAVVVGLIFGAIGAGAGALLVTIVGKIGIPRQVRHLVLLLLGAAAAPVPRHHQPGGRLRRRAAGERALELLPRLAGDAGHPAPGDAIGGVSVMSKLFVDLHIALRSLIQHSRRTLFLGTAIGSVTALLILLNGLSTGIRETMIDTATTLSSGHLNVGGFFKITVGPGGAGRHRLPERAGRGHQVAARDGLRRRARPRLGEAGLRHRLDAGRHQRHRHPTGAALPARSCRSPAASSTTSPSRARS